MGRAIVLGCIFAVVSCGPGGEPEYEVVEFEAEVEQVDAPAAAKDADPTSPSDSEPAVVAKDEDVDAAAPAAGEAPTSPTPVLAAARGAELPGRAPNQCERVRVRIDDKGRRRYKRVRRPWTKADEKRFSQLVTLVAKEMGAEPRLIRAWAMRESTYRPHAMHVLNPDIEAATAAWRRLHYSPTEEAELQAQMAKLSKQDSEYWKAKARLHQVQTFRDNPYLDDIIEFEVTATDGSVSPGSEPAWAFGYGPFGFNPAYFVPVWDSSAPPWVFCDDNGLVAIITAVWAARTAQRECEAQGFGDSYATVNRRFSRGHCATVSPHANFRKRARRLGRNPDMRAKLGRKWKRDTADRGQMLHAMRSKAVAAGLLPASGPSSGS